MKQKISAGIIGILILAVIGLAGLSAYEYVENQKLNHVIKSQKTNEKVVSFLNLFIEKVLKTDKEVSFEDRLKLENAIRDTGDPNLLVRWEQFTGGSNETEIQQGVKDLLEALAKKIVY